MNYGAAIRRLLLNGLGGRSLHVVDATALPFDETATTTTAAVSCFEIGSRPRSLSMRMIGSATSLPPLDAGREVSRNRLGGVGR